MENGILNRESLIKAKIAVGFYDGELPTFTTASEILKEIKSDIGSKFCPTCGKIHSETDLLIFRECPTLARIRLYEIN